MEHIYLIGVMLLTLTAVAVGYRMGRGAGIVPRRKNTQAERRRAEIIARNIESYDGTSLGQREVK